MKSIVMLALASIVPVFFILLALNSARHRRKARKRAEVPPVQTSSRDR